MKNMHDLRKTIRYGILSMLGVVVLFICMVCELRTVRADERIQITNFARYSIFPQLRQKPEVKKKKSQKNSVRSPREPIVRMELTGTCL